MQGPDRAHQGDPRRGNHDHLDRTCPARPDLRGRAPAGARLWARDRDRRASRDHRIEGSSRDLPWARGLMLLETRGLTANYGQFRALFGVDIAVATGECVAIIGAKGAGKSTLMRSITGVIRNEPGMVLHRGQPIGALSSADVMKRGVAMVPEGRRLFPSLTVEENLLIGGQARKAAGPWNLASVYELFPILRERRNSSGVALSGGQQQMVAIGRALMSNPELLLCDEISLGLAPVVIRDIYAALPKVRYAGAAIVVVEQDIGKALAVADRVYCMMEGHVTLVAKASEVTRQEIHAAYFGEAAWRSLLFGACCSRSLVDASSLRRGGDLAGHPRSGNPVGRALRPVCCGAEPRLRHHAARQSRTRRPHRLRRLSRAGWRHAARSVAVGRRAACRATDVRARLAVAEPRLEPCAGQGHPAAAARYFWPLGCPAERAPRGF